MRTAPPLPPTSHYFMRYRMYLRSFLSLLRRDLQDLRHHGSRQASMISPPADGRMAPATETRDAMPATGSRQRSRSLLFNMISYIFYAHSSLTPAPHHWLLLNPDQQESLKSLPPQYEACPTSYHWATTAERVPSELTHADVTRLSHISRSSISGKRACSSPSSNPSPSTITRSWHAERHNCWIVFIENSAATAVHAVSLSDPRCTARLSALYHAWPATRARRSGIAPGCPASQPRQC